MENLSPSRCLFLVVLDLTQSVRQRGDRIFERLKQTCLSLVAEEHARPIVLFRPTSDHTRCSMLFSRPATQKLASSGTCRLRTWTKFSRRGMTEGKERKRLPFSFLYDANNSEEELLSCENYYCFKHDDISREDVILIEEEESGTIEKMKFLL